MQPASVQRGSIITTGQMNGYANISEDFITNTRQTTVINSSSKHSSLFEKVSVSGEAFGDTGNMGGIQVTREFQIMNVAST